MMKSNMKHGFKHRILALFLACTMVGGVLWNKMPDVMAEATFSVDAELGLKSDAITNASDFETISVDSNSGECIIPDPVPGSNVYEFVGWAYEVDVWSNTTDAEGTGMVEADGSGTTIFTKIDLDSTGTTTFEAIWELKENALTVGAKILDENSNSIAYDGTVWTKETITITVDVDDIVSMPVVKFIYAESGSQEPTVDAWTSAEILELNENQRTIEITGEEKVENGTYYFQLTDGFGNVISKSQTVQYCNGLMEADIEFDGTVKNNNKEYYKDIEKITAKVTATADTGVGLASVLLGVAASGEEPVYKDVTNVTPITNPFDKTVNLIDFTNLKEQTLNCIVHVTDYAGNSKTTEFSEIYYDNTAPTVDNVLVLDTYATKNDVAYTNQDFDVYVSAEDNEAGVANVTVTAGAVSKSEENDMVKLLLTEENTYTFEIKAKDALDNEAYVTGAAISGEAVNVKNVILDKTAPTGEMKVEPLGNYVKNEDVLYIGLNGSVKIKANAKDAMSGIVKTEVLVNDVTVQSVNTYDGVTNAAVEYTLSASEISGMAVVSVVATDYAGNSKVLGTNKVAVDMYAPVPTAVDVKVTAAKTVLKILTFGIYSDDSTKVEVTIEDVQTGVEDVIVEDNGTPINCTVEKEGYNAKVTVEVSTEETHELIIKASDKIGNSKFYKLQDIYNDIKDGNLKSNSLVIDKTKPELTVMVSSNAVEYVDNGVHFYNTVDGAVVKFSASDSNLEKIVFAVSETANTENVKEFHVISCTSQAVTDITDSVSLSDVITDEGVRYIKVTAYDILGNYDEKVVAISVDTGKPKVNSYSVNKLETTVDKVLRVLTFGIYSNTAVNVCFNVTDTKAEEIAAGVKNVVVMNGEMPLTVTKNGDNYTVTLDKEELYKLTVYAIDNVGNTSVAKGLNELVSDEGDKIDNNEFIIETKAPVVTLKAVTDNAVMINGAKWYASYNDIKIAYSATDNTQGEDEKYSGLNQVKFYQDGAELTSWAKTFSTKKSDDIFVKNLSSVNGIEKEGTIVLTVQAEDNAGNKSVTVEDTVHVDMKNPKVVDFSFTNVEEPSLVEDALKIQPEKTDYGYFFKRDTVVTVDVKDEEASSGLKELEYVLVDADGQTVVTEGSVTVVNNQAQFPVFGDFKGQIYASVIDNVGHRSAFVGPNGVVMETEETHLVNATAAAVVPENMKSTVEEGYKLFNEDIQVKVSASDTLSGIKNVSWELMVDGVCVESQNINYALIGATIDTDNVTSIDRNLVTGYAETIPVTYEGDEIYIELSFTDRAGYVITVESERFSIDKTAPQEKFIEFVKKDNENPYIAVDGAHYYAKQDKAAFKFEINDAIVSDVKEIGSGIDFIDVKVLKPDTTLVTARVECSESSKEMKVPKEMDIMSIVGTEELAEGEYRVMVSVTDVAGNSKNSEWMNCYIDTTKPVINSYEVKELETAVEKVLNILTFGIYNNEAVDVTITVSDPESNDIATGIRQIIVDNKATEKENDWVENVTTKDTTLYAFTIRLDKFDDDGLYNLEVQVIDNVGNISDVKKLNDLDKNHVISDANEIILEKTAPSVSLSTNNGSAVVDGKKWFGSYNDIKVSYDVKDNGKNWSGLNNIQVYMDKDKNAEALSSDWSVAFNSKTQNYSIKDAVLADKRAYGNINGDGSVILEMTATDNAGNVTISAKEIIYVDNTAPKVMSFDFNPAAIGAHSNNTYDFLAHNVQTTYMVEKYGFFFNQDTDVTVTVDDNGADDKTPSSGIKEITFKLVDLQGKVTESTSLSNNGKAIFRIPAGFKGNIYACVVDNVGHRSGDTRPDGVVVETQTQHDRDAKTTISRPATSLVSMDNLPLYSGDIPVTMNVQDHISGIHTIDWKVTADGTVTQSGKLEVTLEGDLTNDKGWSGVKNSNLITELSKIITVSDDAKVIKVELTLTDRSGYKKYVEDTFTIDKTAPVINVEYDNNSANAKNHTFFKDVRVATITVTERNFDAGMEYVIITNTNSDGVMPIRSEWSVVPGILPNGNDTKHVCTITYAADGDYTFAMSVKDRAGYMNNGIDTQNSVAPYEFTVDCTLPVIDITYDNNELRNSNYSKTTRTATIKVTEHNFSSEDFVLKATAQDGTTTVVFPQMSDFSDNGDIHIATIRFEEDALYTYSVAYTDKAGNDAATVPEEQFYVDLTAPEIIVTNGNDTIINTTTNQGNLISVFNMDTHISPIVEVLDRNFSISECSIVLQHKNGEQIGVTQANITKDAGTGLRYLFDVIEDIAAADGTYQLIMTVTDKAGNITTKEWSFKVNRHGTQLNDNEITKYANTIYNGSELVVGGKKGQDFVLTLTSAQKINLDEFRILLGTIELTSSQYELSDPVEDEKGMYIYSLTILNSAFSQDGDYALSIYTKDDGGIEQELMSFWGKSVNIVVDSTAPVCRVRELTNKKTYKATEKSFEIVVEDKHLDKIKVTLNGETEEFDVEKVEEIKDLNQTGDAEYTLTYVAKAKDSFDAQSLEIACVDIAEHESNEFMIDGEDGEETVKKAEFYVITSGFQAFMIALRQNLVFVIIGVVAVVAIVAGIIVWCTKKKTGRAS